MEIEKLCFIELIKTSSFMINNGKKNAKSGVKFKTQGNLI